MGTVTVKLAAGGGHHCGQDEEGCLFEWYNWLTRQSDSDDSCPPGVSKILHIFGIRLNDALPDEKRQLLARYLPNGSSPLEGTSGDGKDERRGYLALDWLTRIYLPAFLDLAGIPSDLAQHPRVDSLEAAQSIGLLVRQARDKAAAAGAAARDAAWAAAGDAAWAAAGAAAGDAAGDAAWAAARAKLAPTVSQLQDSAIALYDLMIAGECPARQVT